MAERLLLDRKGLKTDKGQVVSFDDLVHILSQSYIGPEPNVTAGLRSEQQDVIEGDVIQVARAIHADYYLSLYSQTQHHVPQGSMKTVNFYRKRPDSTR